jgi:molecular chaperone DnaK (HSP70)
MTRNFPLQASRELHLFYDAGASSTQATVVSFYTVPAASITSKNFTQVDVLGYGHAPSVGGYHIDVKLRDILYEAFERDNKGKLKTPLKQNERGMAKLLKEASRVKHVLSANQAAVARVRCDLAFGQRSNIASRSRTWRKTSTLKRPLRDRSLRRPSKICGRGWNCPYGKHWRWLASQRYLSCARV